MTSKSAAKRVRTDRVRSSAPHKTTGSHGADSAIMIMQARDSPKRTAQAAFGAGSSAEDDGVAAAGSTGRLTGMEAARAAAKAKSARRTLERELHDAVTKAHKDLSCNRDGICVGDNTNVNAKHAAESNESGLGPVHCNACKTTLARINFSKNQLKGMSNTKRRCKKCVARALDSDGKLSMKTLKVALQESVRDGTILPCIYCVMKHLEPLDASKSLTQGIEHPVFLACMVKEIQKHERMQGVDASEIASSLEACTTQWIGEEIAEGLRRGLRKAVQESAGVLAVQCKAALESLGDGPLFARCALASDGNPRLYWRLQPRAVIMETIVSVQEELESGGSSIPFEVPEVAAVPVRATQRQYKATTTQLVSAIRPEKVLTWVEEVLSETSAADIRSTTGLIVEGISELVSGVASHSLSRLIVNGSISESGICGSIDDGDTTGDSKVGPHTTPPEPSSRVLLGARSLTLLPSPLGMGTEPVATAKSADGVTCVTNPLHDSDEIHKSDPLLDNVLRVVELHQARAAVESLEDAIPWLWVDADRWTPATRRQLLRDLRNGPSLDSLVLFLITLLESLSKDGRAAIGSRVKAFSQSLMAIVEDGPSALTRAVGQLEEDVEAVFESQNDSDSALDVAPHQKSGNDSADGIDGDDDENNDAGSGDNCEESSESDHSDALSSDHDADIDDADFAPAGEHEEDWRQIDKRSELRHKLTAPLKATSSKAKPGPSRPVRPREPLTVIPFPQLCSEEMRLSEEQPLNAVAHKRYAIFCPLAGSIFEALHGDDKDHGELGAVFTYKNPAFAVRELVFKERLLELNLGDVPWIQIDPDTNAVLDVRTTKGEKLSEDRYLEKQMFDNYDAIFCTFPCGTLSMLSAGTSAETVQKRDTSGNRYLYQGIRFVQHNILPLSVGMFMENAPGLARNLGATTRTKICEIVADGQQAYQAALTKQSQGVKLLPGIDARSCFQGVTIQLIDSEDMGLPTVRPRTMTVLTSSVKAVQFKKCVRNAVTVETALAAIDANLIPAAQTRASRAALKNSPMYQWVKQRNGNLTHEQLVKTVVGSHRRHVTLLEVVLSSITEMKAFKSHIASTAGLADHKECKLFLRAVKKLFPSEREEGESLDGEGVFDDVTPQFVLKTLPSVCSKNSARLVHPTEPRFLVAGELAALGMGLPVDTKIPLEFIPQGATVVSIRDAVNGYMDAFPTDMALVVQDRRYTKSGVGGLLSCRLEFTSNQTAVPAPTTGDTGNDASEQPFEMVDCVGSFDAPEHSEKLWKHALTDCSQLATGAVGVSTPHRVTESVTVFLSAATDRIPTTVANARFTLLLEELHWRRSTNYRHLEACLVNTYSLDRNVVYNYSKRFGDTTVFIGRDDSELTDGDVHGKALSPNMRQLLRLIAKEADHVVQRHPGHETERTSTVQPRLYPTGGHAIPPHTDNEAVMGSDPWVLSHSYGAMRTMRWYMTQERGRTEMAAFPLQNGDVMLAPKKSMEGTNHAVPNEAVPDARICVTLRPGVVCEGMDVSTQAGLNKTNVDLLHCTREERWRRCSVAEPGMPRRFQSFAAVRTSETKPLNGVDTFGDRVAGDICDTSGNSYAGRCTESRAYFKALGIHRTAQGGVMQSHGLVESQVLRYQSGSVDTGTTVHFTIHNNKPHTALRGLPAAWIRTWHAKEPVRLVRCSELGAPWGPKPAHPDLKTFRYDGLYRVDSVVEVKSAVNPNKHDLMVTLKQLNGTTYKVPRRR